MNTKRLLSFHNAPRITAPDSAHERLKTSQAFRAQYKTDSCACDVGTAERRPQRGLLYDAPLGLKF